MEISFNDIMTADEVMHKISQMTPKEAFKFGYKYAQREVDKWLQPETGEWIEHHEPFTWMGYTYWTCSKCNFGEKEENKTRSNFCPDCGVKMIPS